jgi:RecA-family ATPase
VILYICLVWLLDQFVAILFQVVVVDRRLVVDIGANGAGVDANAFLKRSRVLAKSLTCLISLISSSSFTQYSRYSPSLFCHGCVFLPDGSFY